MDLQNPTDEEQAIAEVYSDDPSQPAPTAIIESDYWALQAPDDIGDEIKTKMTQWDHAIRSMDLIAHWSQSWRMYNGQDESRGPTGTWVPGLKKVGENGSSLFFVVNQLRSLIRTVIGLLVNNPPSFDVSAVNSDSQSLQLAVLGRQILEYYMKHYGVGRYLERACETSFIFDSSFISVEWDVNEGKQYGPEAIRQEWDGDIAINAPLPWDVCYDVRRPTWESQDFVIIRRWVPRSKLIASYHDKPALIDAIKSAPKKSAGEQKLFDVMLWIRLEQISDQLNDDVGTLRLYHRKSAILPNGRYTEVLLDGTVLYDGNLPYAGLPIERFTIHEFPGTCLGRSPIQDLIPLQQSINIASSTIISQQNALGLNIIGCPEGVDLKASDLGRGIMLLKYPPGTEKPAPIPLLANAAEIFQFRSQLIGEMEQILGVSEVSRGRHSPGAPEAASGLALMASTTAQNQGSLQQNYADFAGRVATSILRLLQSFAANPRTIAILGESTSGKTTFSSADLIDFDRVTVAAGNSLASTPAGRLQIAQTLMQQGMINPQEFIAILETGTYEPEIEGAREEIIYIKRENEMLAKGIPVKALISDPHPLHIGYHRKLLSNVDLRVAADQGDQKAQALIQSVTDHIQQHLQLAQDTGQPAPPQGIQPPTGGPPGGPQAPNAPKPPVGNERPPKRPTAVQGGAIDQQATQQPAISNVGAHMPAMPRPPVAGGRGTQTPNMGP